jgi:hypothetical protein
MALWVLISLQLQAAAGTFHNQSKWVPQAIGKTLDMEIAWIFSVACQEGPWNQIMTL